MRNEQQMIREWADAQSGEQNREIRKDLLEHLAHRAPAAERS